jgi:hypothetical protein
VRSGTPTTRASRSDSACFGCCGNPTATYLVNFMPIRLATPGGTLTSWITMGSSRRHAARYAGTDTYPPKPTTTSAWTSSITLPAACADLYIRSGVRSRFRLTERGSWNAGMMRRS